jgi:tripartite-type tricarboxylate transporter receptor subunit TctC
MELPRRKFLQLTAGAVALPAVSHKSWAQSFPSRPLRWVIGFPPGGGADIVARIVAARLSERLGQQVVIENKPGAGTNLATETVVNSPADGYTMLWVGSSNVINATLYSSLPFDFSKAIAPVSGMVLYPMVIEVNPSVPAKNIIELIALAKANPGKMTLASYGTGTISHVAGEMFKSMAGIQMVHVPYRGGAPMVNDLMGGQVQAALDVVTGSLAHIRSGAIRALGVTTKARIADLPNVPTIAETVPGYEAVTFTGVGVPAGTPEGVIALLNREINACLVEPALKARLAELIVTPLIQTPREFGGYMVAETEKWSQVIRLANIRAD